MFTDFINALSDLLYSRILIVLLLGTGIYFSVRTRFVQFRLFAESIRVVAQPNTEGNGLSSFQALMVSTASRVGTGNIAGISTAICLGGAGAVFWMWLTAILGSASAFIESTLAQIYKRKAEDGSSYGGPAYYIQGSAETALDRRSVRCLSDPDLYGRISTLWRPSILQTPSGHTDSLTNPPHRSSWASSSPLSSPCVSSAGADRSRGSRKYWFLQWGSSISQWRCSS